MDESLTSRMRKDIKRIEDLRDDSTGKMIKKGGSDALLNRAQDAFNEKRKSIMNSYKTEAKGSDSLMSKVNKGDKVVVPGGAKSHANLKLDPDVVSSLRGDRAVSLAPKGKANMFKKFMKGAKSAGKAIPGLGAILGVGLGLMGEDASAALPDAIVPGGVEGLGPKAGSIGSIVENPSMSPEQKQKAIEMLQKKYRGI